MYTNPDKKAALQYASLATVLAFVTLTLTTAQAGTLDPTFGTGGRLITHITNNNTNPTKVFVLPDGKILIAGTTYLINAYAPAPVLARYNSNGTLDTSFGIGGMVYNQTGDTQINEALLQPDGKIVLVGGSGITVGNFPNSLPRDFTVRRYNSNGSLDSSFGNSGIVVTSIGDARDVAYGAALLPDGRILAVGRTFVDSFSPGTIDLVRYNSDGTLDSTFGDGGIVYYFVPGSGAFPFLYDAILLSDGKFLTNGRFGDSRFLARFNADGSFDTTFGTNGFVYSPLVQAHMILQADGKIVLTRTDGFSLARMNSDGSVDYSFGVNGTVLTTFRRVNVGNAPASCYDAVLKDNGDIVALGSAEINVSGLPEFAVAHYNSSGALIAKSTVSFPPYETSTGTTLALQPDGKIIISGFAEFAGIRSMATARLTSITTDHRPYKRAYDFNGDFKDDFIVYRPGTGSSSGVWYNASRSSSPAFGLTGDVITPADYNDDGITDLAVFRPSNGTWYIANDYDNAASNFTTIPWGASGDIPAAGDYDSDGKADVTVFRPGNGTWYILDSKTNSARAVQWGISGDKPVVGDFDNDGNADVAVFRPSNGTWYVLKSSDNQLLAVQFGQSGDIPVQADYNGDGRTEMIIFRPSNNTWYTSFDPATNYGAIQFGANGDIPVPGDYTGDGKADIAVWRPANRVWYVRSSSNGSVSGQQYGTSTDIPVPGN